MTRRLDAPRVPVEGIYALQSSSAPVRVKIPLGNRAQDAAIGIDLHMAQRRVVITRVASGISVATVDRFLSEGTVVIVLDRIQPTARWANQVRCIFWRAG